jgi:hypothetical protein
MRARGGAGGPGVPFVRPALTTCLLVVALLVSACSPEESAQTPTEVGSPTRTTVRFLAIGDFGTGSRLSRRLPTRCAPTSTVSPSTSS